jgi:TonB family protein
MEKKTLSFVVLLLASLPMIAQQVSVQPNKPETVTVYTQSEIDTPVKVSGYKDFKDFAAKNMTYPADAKAKRVIGRVKMTAVINEKGEVTKVCLVSPVYPSLDAEAVRLLESAKWVPAKKGGKSVRAEQGFYIDFMLK